MCSIIFYDLRRAADSEKRAPAKMGKTAFIPFGYSIGGVVLCLFDLPEVYRWDAGQPFPAFGSEQDVYKRQIPSRWY